jgi:aerobic carbon-monoxide dehydrogenase medium subunit
VKPARFAYFRPRSLDEALDILAAHDGQARPLAGGQSLVPAMNFRLAQPAALVDLNHIGELFTIDSPLEGGLRLGGMTRHRTLETHALVAAHAPLVRETMRWVAHPPIRTRGTIGGSLAHADPAAELPAVCLALEAQCVLRTRARSRTVPASEFFLGLYTTALEPDELLTEVVLPPLRPRSGWALDEVARRHGDYAIAGATAVVTLDEEGRCASARIALLSVHDRPVLALRAMAMLSGQDLAPELLRTAARVAARDDADPSSDIHGSAAYRRRLVDVIVTRVLERAVERARGACGAGGGET